MMTATLTTPPLFIVSEVRKDTGLTHYVVARPGYYRKAIGGYGRDGSFKGGPEWSKTRSHAFLFKSHRAAAIVAGSVPAQR